MAERYMPVLRRQGVEELAVDDLRGCQHKLRYTYWINSSISGRQVVHWQVRSWQM
jgi:hypothetical protein